ncbi:MAG: hypothetical protein LBR42_01520 [Candidatus Methanoplasma sp.]|jgi:hypothetical protein|nr:hypothetical protein [Candidatus Methanoplasma sp.]
MFGRKKKKISRNRSKATYVFGSIDDTNTGGRDQGKYQVLAGTVVDADKKDAFAAVSEKRNTGKKVKFVKRKRTREKALCEISELNPRVYAVRYKKPELLPDKEEQNRIHVSQLSGVIHLIAKKEKAKNIELYIERTRRITDEDVKAIAEYVGRRYKKNITAEFMEDPENCFALQSAEYAAGALNQAYNRRDKRYVEILGTKVVRGRRRNKP